VAVDTMYVDPHFVIEMCGAFPALCGMGMNMAGGAIFIC